MAHWRNCGVCKKSISLGGVYQVCSISSCKRKHAFCSVTCWDAHNGVMNHKSAWAEEERAPTSLDSGDANSERVPKKIIVSGKKPTGPGSLNDNLPRDVLIVASKLKNYIKCKGDMNTAGNVMDRLSDIVRHACNDAIERARMEGRKTVMDRDFQ